jgi:hypothetical protein
MSTTSTWIRLPATVLGVFSLFLMGNGFARAADEPVNPLMQQLCQGLVLDDQTKVPLPSPLMADGLNAQAQQKVIEKLVGEAIPLPSFVSKAVVAPYVLKVQQVASRPEAPVFGVDVYFIAHGPLEVVAGKHFLEDWQNTQKDRQVHILTAEELKKRKLTDPAGPGVESRYSHAVFSVIDRVQLAATLHTVVTRRADSLVSASQLDPRFNGDPQFANQWRSLSRDEDGRLQLGPPQSYAGSGAYLKVTRLAEPGGALFVEYHLLYTEPKGWFGGANPLRSKLHTLTQSEVRSFRTALNKAKK